MNSKGLKELDTFLMNCGVISQEEREEIMEFVGGEKKQMYKIIYAQYEYSFGDLVTEHVKILKQRDTYKKAYDELMDYWESFGKEQQEALNIELKRLGL